MSDGSQVLADVARGRAAVPTRTALARVSPRPARGRLANSVLLAYLAILLLAPPLPLQIDFASRGLKIDQLLILALGLPLLLVQGRRLLGAMTSRVGGAVCAFAAASLLSSIWSILFVADSSPAAAFATAWGSFRVPLVFACTYALSCSIPALQRQRVLYAVLLIGMAIVGVAVAQLSGTGPIYDLSVQYYVRKAEFEAIVNGLEAGRVYGTFDGQPNVFGTFCLMCVALTGALYSFRRGVSGRITLLVSIAVLSAGLVISWSRGAYAGTMVAVTVLLTKSGWRRAAKFGLLASALAIIMFFAMPEGPRHRFELLFTGRGYGDASIFETRLPYWQENLDRFLESPILGVRGVPVVPFDSLLLALAVSSGVLGVATFLWALWCVWRALRRIAANGDPGLRPLALGLMAVVVGMLVNGLSIPTFFGERIQELFWALVALALAPLPLAVSRGRRHRLVG